MRAAYTVPRLALAMVPLVTACPNTCQWLSPGLTVGTLSGGITLAESSVDRSGLLSLQARLTWKPRGVVLELDDVDFTRAPQIEMDRQARELAGEGNFRGIHMQAERADGSHYTTMAHHNDCAPEGDTCQLLPLRNPDDIELLRRLASREIFADVILSFGFPILPDTKFLRVFVGPKLVLELKRSVSSVSFQLLRSHETKPGKLESLYRGSSVLTWRGPKPGWVKIRGSTRGLDFTNMQTTMGIDVPPDFQPRRWRVEVTDGFQVLHVALEVPETLP